MSWPSLLLLWVPFGLQAHTALNAPWGGTPPTDRWQVALLLFVPFLLNLLMALFITQSHRLKRNVSPLDPFMIFVLDAVYIVLVLAFGQRSLVARSITIATLYAGMQFAFVALIPSVRASLVARYNRA